MSPMAKLLILTALVPGSAAAQPAAKSAGEIQQLLKPGQMVVVTDSAGETIKGRLTEVNEVAVVVQPKKHGTASVSGLRTLAWDNLSTIQRLDSRWNGALLGLWVGLSTTVAWRIGCNQVFRSSDWDHERVRSCRAAASSRRALSLVPIGAAIGAFIDDRIRGDRMTVRQGRTRRIALRPTLAAKEFSLAASVDFTP
jgi:hypothetical protein